MAEKIRNINQAPLFDVDTYRNMFLAIRDEFDKCYLKRNKSKEGAEAYDHAIDVVVEHAVEESSFQDFMGYCYKKGKYDFVLMNYEKYMKWSILSAANANAFAISKLMLFLNSAIQNVLDDMKHSSLIRFLGFTFENYTYFTARMLCQEIARIMNIVPASLLTEKEVLMDYSDSVLREFEKAKEEAIPNVIAKFNEMYDAFVAGPQKVEEMQKEQMAKQEAEIQKEEEMAEKQKEEQKAAEEKAAEVPIVQRKKSRQFNEKVNYKKANPKIKEILEKQEPAKKAETKQTQKPLTKNPLIKGKK